MKQKLFTFFLTLIASVSAIYASDTQVDGIWYDFDSSTKTASVTYRGSSYSSYEGEYSGSVTIPETVTYNGITYSVTRIGYKAFSDCSSLTSVTIPNSVTSTGMFVFENCSSLTKTNYTGDVAGWCNINFDGVYANPMIYSHNFYINDQEIKDLVIPNSVTSIRPYTFAYCSSLTSVTIPNSVTSIGQYTFAGCSSLASITIPNSVTSIGNGAFLRCSFIKDKFKNQSTLDVEANNYWGAHIADVEINGLLIRNDTVVGCRPSVTMVIFPDYITCIGESAFYNCSSLTSVTIPESVTSIGDDAFYSCTSLTLVTIPNSVTSIGSSAFRNCSSLTSVTIGESVTSIGSSAFRNCSSLTSVTIGESVTSIGSWAFYDCSSLTSVTINSNAIVSKDYSYDDNISDIFGSQVAEYIIGDDVKKIGSYAFCVCSSLTSVTIGNSVTSIGSSVFENCSSLTSVTIGESVTSIRSWAFYDCSSLTSVTINSNAIVSKDYYDDNISDIFGSQVTEYIIGESVTSIGDYAFSKCYKLTSVTIGNSVTSIGRGAFWNCSSLTSITCEAETPPTLGSYTFDGVSTSIPVNVPCGCEEAYKTASGWKDFTNIQEPLLEYSIEVYVNDTIMGSAKVDYHTFCEGNQISATPNIGYHFVQWNDGNTDAIRTLELTQDTILTAEFAQSFSGQCGDNLYWSYDETTKTVSITGSGKMYDYTADTQPWLLFKNQLVEVTTSNTVTSIGTSAFEGCIRLSKISLGTGLEEIAANAFAGCTRLYDIYVYAAYPPFADESSFANYNVYVYIPCEYQRDYTLDVVWGKFKFIECIDSEEATTDGNVTIVPGYNDVTITWPTEDNADNYAIVIEKDGEVFCTLTFNADGQLLNIAFAPARNGDNRPVQYAEQAVSGYRFTVTGLTEATRYAYNVTTKDAANKTIATYSGEFTTKGGITTAVEDILHSTTMCQKLLRDGQLIIIRDGKTYNVMGTAL